MFFFFFTKSGFADFADAVSPVIYSRPSGLLTTALDERRNDSPAGGGGGRRERVHHRSFFFSSIPFRPYLRAAREVRVYPLGAGRALLYNLIII